MTFRSWRSWRRFADYVSHDARYVLDGEQQEFLRAVEETSGKRSATLEKGRILWRAQLAHDYARTSILDENDDEMEGWDDLVPAPRNRMIPLPRARENRANPRGIPHLYLAEKAETAMGEMRPWIGSLISVAGFMTTRDITLMDCSLETSNPMQSRPLIEPSEEVRESYVWWRINSAFTEPTTRSDDLADYAPTQILSECFRMWGYGGVMYNSALGNGKNVVLFKLGDAQMVSCHVYRVTNANFEFAVAGCPYFPTLEIHPPERQEQIRVDPLHVAGSESSRATDI